MSLSKTLYPLLSTGSAQEDRKSSRHDWGRKTSTQTKCEEPLKYSVCNYRSMYTYKVECGNSLITIIFISFVG